MEEEDEGRETRGDEGRDTLWREMMREGERDGGRRKRMRGGGKGMEDEGRGKGMEEEDEGRGARGGGR